MTTASSSWQGRGREPTLNRPGIVQASAIGSRVGLRLLCTWIGEGTEWLAHEDVIRKRLGHQPGGWGEVKKSRAKVHRMEPFAVGVLKGEGWPGNIGRGAVHRSPAPATWRVFVSLDAL